ncbi:peptide ABC transporter substrate-binding protein [Lactobacillus sp. LC28-10]|uniref:Peptide ABC transporter substrate-binding protein n=1 Tax=Secundilactobacillus angelensis TaxID=2722706 RepID=A0ABX1L0E9_9LACO|nr:peptide ABC transporter substrate-binding protein [Secundilactobacillus angelensis]MCH5463114.1 peptide ABC transporter substrate-binding protein [Secundilactobacillus angelensis]NLR18967.1 peptide ABC transporter substrate-binding protein [Secundilactobacillus angelensis]
MTFKKILLGIGSIALVLTLTACGSSKSSSSGQQMATKQVLNLSTTDTISTLDNSAASESVSLTALYATNEGLYRLGEHSKIENALATKTQVSKDGLTYTFNIRQDDKWSDGKPVTAQDFVYSWRRTANPKTAANYAYLFDGIKNFSAIQKGKLSPDQLGVAAPSKDKLVVTLSQPVPYFKLLLAFPTFFPEEQSAVTKYGKQYGNNAQNVTNNGPFKVADWNGTNNTWTLKKNPNYWDKKHVHLSQINYQVVKSPSTGLNLYNQNKLDVTPLSGTQVANYQSNKGFKKFEGGSMMYLQMNQKRNKALKNVKVRQALAQIVNKQTLATKVLRDGSTAPKGFVSTNLSRNPKTKADFATDAYVKSGVTYDSANAKKLWAEGMKQVGQKKLTLTLLSDDTDQAKTTTQYLQDQFQKLPGLKVNIDNVPYKNRLARSSNGNFDLVVSMWGADFADPINFLSLQESNNPTNNGKWSNSDYDKLIKASQTTDANNQQRRYEDLVNAEKVLMKDQGIIPLYQPSTTELWRPSVHGYVWNPAGMSRGLKNIYITK